MWIGIDDTDSPDGGCTTWVLTEVLAVARDHGLDLLGAPRLVRLNPNIPFKTRGNAALSARFGRGAGRTRTVGSIGGRPVVAFSGGRALSSGAEVRFREAAWTRVLARAPVREGTDPAIVASRRRLPARVYWDAVREVVPVESTVRTLEGAGAWYRHRGDPQGLVGAAAAVAWTGRRGTWELVAYRDPARWGTRRAVDAVSVRAAARSHPELFLCDDPRTRRLLVAPHTACPILFGIRGTDAATLLDVRTEIRSEPVERWVLFRTNQATGDHLRRRTVEELTPYTSGEVAATVREFSQVLPGGHARVTVGDDHGAEIEVLAFEPTKTLPRVVRALAPGDRVLLRGSRGKDRILRLESLRIVRWAPRFGPSRAPECPACGRRARSLGRGRGYRCPECHRRWPPESATRTTDSPPFPPAEEHPTPSARRHLHPLVRERPDSARRESF